MMMGEGGGGELSFMCKLLAAVQIKKFIYQRGN